MFSTAYTAAETAMCARCDFHDFISRSAAPRKARDSKGQSGTAEYFFTPTSTVLANQLQIVHHMHYARISLEICLFTQCTNMRHMCNTKLSNRPQTKSKHIFRFLGARGRTITVFISLLFVFAPDDNTDTLKQYLYIGVNVGVFSWSV